MGARRSESKTPRPASRSDFCRLCSRLSSGMMYSSLTCAEEAANTLEHDFRLQSVTLLATLLGGCILGAAVSVACVMALGTAGLFFVPKWSVSSLRCTCVRDFVTIETPTLSQATLALVAVQANTSWQDTGINVSRGETVRIAYVCGQWCPWKGFCLDGRGCVNVDPAVCSPNLDDPANLIPALHASLIARIGENSAFPVGNELTFQATHSGPLQLRINDVRVEDNSGVLVVLVATGACASDNP